MSCLAVMLAALLAENFVAERVFGLESLLGLPLRRSVGPIVSLMTVLMTGVSVAAVGAILRFVPGVDALPFLPALLCGLVSCAIALPICANRREMRHSEGEKVRAAMPAAVINASGAALLVLNAGSTWEYPMLILFGFFAGLGIFLMWLLLGLVEDRIKYADVPAAMRGTPILLVAAALVALFMTAFSGVGSIL